jgi:glutathione S-transferase
LTLTTNPSTMTDTPIDPSTTAPAGAAAAAAGAYPKITLHYLDSSRSHRILWLLEELAIPYDIQVHCRKKNMLAPQSLRDVHPLGKAPVLVVSPTSGPGASITVAESANIVEFLLRHYGNDKFTPAQYVVGREREGPLGESEAFTRYRYLMHFAEGTMMPYLVFEIVLGQLKGPAVPFLVRPLTKMIAGQVETMFTRPNIKAKYDLLEGYLRSIPGVCDYFTGSELSGAVSLILKE